MPQAQIEDCDTRIDDSVVSLLFLRGLMGWNSSQQYKPEVACKVTMMQGGKRCNAALFARTRAN